MNKLLDAYFSISPKLLILCLIGVGTLSLWLYAIAFRADTFTVDSKNWECKASQPIGIRSECIKLEKKI